MKRSKSIVEALNEFEGLRPGSETPAPERMEAIRSVTARSLTPVRPLPANGVLILLAVAGFAAFALLVAAPIGLGGFHHLSPEQRLAYYAVTLLCAALLSSAVVKELIPGSRRRLSSLAAAILPLVLLIFTARVLFPRHDLSHFVAIGFPCLRLGTICAAVVGLIAYPLLRRCFSTSPVRAGAIAGLWAGLAGFGVLALHCSVQNSAHIVVWHLGALLIAASAGALIGRWIER